MGKAVTMLSNTQNAKDYSLTLETSSGLSYYISRPLLDAHGILVVFTTRRGGLSPDPYSALNLAFHVGDNSDLVIENRKKVLGLFGLDLGRVVCAEQVHGTGVAYAGDSDAGCGALSLEESIKGVDALFSDCDRMPLLLFFADCVPVVLVEPEKRVVGVIHAGWKGVYGNITGNAIDAISSRLSASSKNMLAFIGPSIGSCCYQVGSDLVKKFSERFDSSDDWLFGDRIDLRIIVKKQLSDGGIPAANIHPCHDCCTSCNSEILYSHRNSGGKTGRQAALASILSK